MTFIEISHSESTNSITPYSLWKQVNATIRRCLLFMTCKQQIYTYDVDGNLIFRICILDYPI